jgi:hypothetical protein
LRPTSTLNGEPHSQGRTTAQSVRQELGRSKFKKKLSVIQISWLDNAFIGRSVAPRWGFGDGSVD